MDAKSDLSMRSSYTSLPHPPSMGDLTQPLIPDPSYPPPPAAPASIAIPITDNPPRGIRTIAAPRTTRNDWGFLDPDFLLSCCASVCITELPFYLQQFCSFLGAFLSATMLISAACFLFSPPVSSDIYQLLEHRIAILLAILFGFVCFLACLFRTCFWCCYLISND